MEVKEKEAFWFVLIVLVCGCLCGGEGRGRVENTPIINFYGTTPSTSSTTSTTLMIVFNATTTTSFTTITTSTSSTSTTTTSTTTSLGWIMDYKKRVAPPTINVSPEYRVCKQDKDCLVVGDCCGEVGRQYSINKVYRMRWYDKLACWNVSGGCITNLNLKLNRYEFSICQNYTCTKTYNSPN